jgi:hypothetical protein
VSSAARITYGEIGSTFPLLDIEDTTFCRVGSMADIFATGFRPLSHSNPTASAIATDKKITILFRSMRSMLTYFSLLLSLAHRHWCKRFRAPWHAFPWSWLAGYPSGWRGVLSFYQEPLRFLHIPCFQWREGIAL